MTKPTDKTSDIQKTLDERGKRYGTFADQARYAQRLKAIFQSSPNWDKMDNDQREALDMLATKVARILNGDFNYADSWHDIAGYIKLVDDRLAQEEVGFHSANKSYGLCAGKPIYNWDEWRKCVSESLAQVGG